MCTKKFTSWVTWTFYVIFIFGVHRKLMFAISKKQNDAAIYSEVDDTTLYSADSANLVTCFSGEKSQTSWKAGWRPITPSWSSWRRVRATSSGTGSTGHPCPARRVCPVGRRRPSGPPRPPCRPGRVVRVGRQGPACRRRLADLPGPCRPRCRSAPSVQARPSCRQCRPCQPAPSRRFCLNAQDERGSQRLPFSALYLVCQARQPGQVGLRGQRHRPCQRRQTCRAGLCLPENSHVRKLPDAYLVRFNSQQVRWFQLGQLVPSGLLGTCGILDRFTSSFIVNSEIKLSRNLPFGISGKGRYKRPFSPLTPALPAFPGSLQSNHKLVQKARETF